VCLAEFICLNGVRDTLRPKLMTIGPRMPNVQNQQGANIPLRRYDTMAQRAFNFQ